MITVEELAKLQQIAVYDPVAVAEATFKTLENLSINGGDITLVDPSNPFILSLTNQSILAATMMEHSSDLNRKHYPFMARTLDDLYFHMSDKDFIGRFANPSRITTMFRIQVADLMQRAVDVPELNCHQVIIPRNSTLTIDGTVFTLLYPIVIRKYKLGKFAITWDTELDSPLQTLSTNIIPSKVIKYAGNDFLTFTFDMLQLKITSESDTISLSSDLRFKIKFTDDFHACRVFNVRTDSFGNKSRTELKITHNALLYDAKTPTAILSVSNGYLNVYIPAIYASSGLLTYNSNIQVDVYTTKGNITMGLGGFAITEFVFKLESTFKEDINKFVSPLTNMNTMQVFSASTTMGGTAELTFDELKEKVISNGIGDPKIPISPTKLKYALKELGYDSVINIDNIVTRTCLATKTVPIPKNDRLHSPVATTVETFIFTGSMSSYSNGIIEHQNAYTITPECLFKINNGQVELISDSKLDQLKVLSPSVLAAELNAERYYWTPFYYVLDTSNNQLDLRAYHLDEPDIVTMSFETENNSTDLKSSTTGYEIKKIKNGYELFIYTSCSDSYMKLPTDQLWVQLSFTPKGSNIPATLNGTLYGAIENGYAWSFRIETNYNCNSDDELILSNFLMYDVSARYIPISLDVTFNILHGVSTTLPATFRQIDSDNLLNRDALSLNSYSLTHEYLNVVFGKNLKHLWKPARSFVNAEHERHQEDVYLTYTEDKYEQNPDGSYFKVVDGELVYNLLHYKGEVITIDGVKQLAARKGDYIVRDGSKVPVADRYMVRHVDLLFMEAAFRFADTDKMRKYLSMTLDSIITASTEDMARIYPRMLERPELYYMPKKTASVVTVQINGTVTKMDAAQSLVVTYNVMDGISESSDTSEQIEFERITSEVLSSEFSTKSIISISSLEEKLKSTIGSSVINVMIVGLGGERNLQVVILPDPSERLTIAKRVKSRTSGELYVEDDIVVIRIKEQDLSK